MPSLRLSPLLLYGLLLLGAFAVAATGGYVYAHEPERDVLLVDFEATPQPPPATISGSVVAIEDGTLTLATPDGGQVTLALPADAPIEDLVRLEEALPEGATVNVGVDDTQFGQVLTGIVWIGAPS